MCVLVVCRPENVVVGQRKKCLGVTMVGAMDAAGKAVFNGLELFGRQCL